MDGASAAGSASDASPVSEFAESVPLMDSTEEQSVDETFRELFQFLDSGEYTDEFIEQQKERYEELQRVHLSIPAGSAQRGEVSHLRFGPNNPPQDFHGYREQILAAEAFNIAQHIEGWCLDADKKDTKELKRDLSKMRVDAYIQNESLASVENDGLTDSMRAAEEKAFVELSSILEFSTTSSVFRLADLTEFNDNISVSIKTSSESRPVGRPTDAKSGSGEFNRRERLTFIMRQISRACDFVKWKFKMIGEEEWKRCMDLQEQTALDCIEILNPDSIARSDSLGSELSDRAPEPTRETGARPKTSSKAVPKVDRPEKLKTSSLVELAADSEHEVHETVKGQRKRSKHELKEVLDFIEDMDLSRMDSTDASLKDYRSRGVDVVYHNLEGGESIRVGGYGNRILTRTVILPLSRLTCMPNELRRIHTFVCETLMVVDDYLFMILFLEKYMYYPVFRIRGVTSHFHSVAGLNIAKLGRCCGPIFITKFRNTCDAEITMCSAAVIEKFIFYFAEYLLGDPSDCFNLITFLSCCGELALFCASEGYLEYASVVSHMMTSCIFLRMAKQMDGNGGWLAFLERCSNSKDDFN